LKASAW